MKNNYRCVDTCMICKFHIQDSDYDEPTSYYCNIENLFKQEFRLTQYGNENSEKYKWFTEHCVDCDGICDDFKKQEENNG
jgi:hypothetical protein